MPEDFKLPPLADDLPLSCRYRAPSGKARGLVILLHGVGSNETSMAPLAALLPKDFAVVLVRSPIPMGGGAFAAFPVTFTPAGPVIDAAAAEKSRLALAEFTAGLQARTGITPSRTLVSGFSQGGIMSASLALTHPELVAGFAIISGRILPEIDSLIASPDALAGVHALILHGSADATLPVGWAEKSDALLSKLGISYESRRYAAGHQITNDMAGTFVDWVASRLPACPD